MYHYTYVIIDKTPKDSHRYYIGCRSCRSPIEGDKYMGSCKTLKKILKERPEDFKKVVLATHYNRYMAIWHECILHEAFDVARSPLFYNQAKQTSTGFDCSGIKFDERRRQKITGPGNPNYGKRASEERRRQMSIDRKGKQVGEKNGMYGKHRSDATKEKIRKARLGKYSGENNPFFGKHHTEETKQKLRNRVVPEEARKKMSKKAKGRPSPMRGKCHTEETKQKLHQSRLGRYCGDKSIRYLKDILIEDILKLKSSGNTISKIASILGCSKSTIKRRLAKRVE